MTGIFSVRYDPNTGNKQIVFVNSTGSLQPPIDIVQQQPPSLNIGAISVSLQQAVDAAPPGDVVTTGDLQSL